MIVQSGGSGNLLATHNSVSMRVKPICLASITKTNTHQLRTQLHQLHSEAQSTQLKVNSARLRLMRLSEAAEKLKRQAAISVNAGKENEARDLLFQKKKVMQAIERSKSRIQLLDELSAKLNEAISLKESQLIGNIAVDNEVDAGDDSGPVRVVAPTQELTNDINVEKDSRHAAPGFVETEEFQFTGDSERFTSPDKQFNSLDMQICNEDSNSEISSIEGISSYYEFLEHLDLKFRKIESEFVTVLNVSSWVLNGEDPEVPKLRQLMELLGSVQAIRQRIVQIMQWNVEIK